jgi:hypothetical protein
MHSLTTANMQLLWRVLLDLKMLHLDNKTVDSIVSRMLHYMQMLRHVKLNVFLSSPKLQHQYHF